MDWPQRSPRVVALFLTLGKGCGGAAFPLSLAFSVDSEQVADLLAECPESADRGVAGEDGRRLSWRESAAPTRGSG